MSFSDSSGSGSAWLRALVPCLALIVGLGVWASDARAAGAKEKAEHKATAHHEGAGALVDHEFLHGLRTRLGRPDSAWPDVEDQRDAQVDRLARRLKANQFALERQLQFLETYPLTHRVGPRTAASFLRREQLVAAELARVDQELDALGVPEINASGLTSAAAAAALGVLILGGRRRVAAVCPS